MLIKNAVQNIESNDTCSYMKSESGIHFFSDRFSGVSAWSWYCDNWISNQIWLIWLKKIIQLKNWILSRKFRHLAVTGESDTSMLHVCWWSFKQDLSPPAIRSIGLCDFRSWAISSCTPEKIWFIPNTTSRCPTVGKNKVYQ